MIRNHYPTTLPQAWFSARLVAREPDTGARLTPAAQGQGPRTAPAGRATASSPKPWSGRGVALARSARSAYAATSDSSSPDTAFAQPLRQFETIERAALTPLPLRAYDLALWKEVTVARDCYVVFEKSFYSVPFRLVGQKVRLRGGTESVQLYTTDYALVATHSRAQQPGERLTHLDHLPPEKLPGLLQTREGCLAAAADIGPATAQVAQALLDDGVLDRLPTVGRLLRLREAHGDERLEAACGRALAFDDPRYATIKGILLERSEQAPVPEEPPAAQANFFARSARDLLGHVFGSALWT